MRMSVQWRSIMSTFVMTLLITLTIMSNNGNGNGNGALVLAQPNRPVVATPVAPSIPDGASGSEEAPAIENVDFVVKKIDAPVDDIQWATDDVCPSRNSYSIIHPFSSPVPSIHLTHLGSDSVRVLVPPSFLPCLC
jgi:hypothetical protein